MITIGEPHSENILEIVGCPICGDLPGKVWLDDGKPTRYVRCPGCGTVYLSPRLSKITRIAGFNTKYSDISNTKALAEARRSVLQIEAQILQKLKSSGKLLDVGCNNGLFFEFFDKSNWLRYGVEIAEAAASVAQQNHDAQIFTGTLTAAHFPDRLFDLVTMIDMFYHVDDPHSVLAEVRRILKPNGLMAIEIAGQAYMLTRSRGLICFLLSKQWTRLRTDSTYLYWYSLPGLERLLRKSGFRVREWLVVTSLKSSGAEPAFLDQYARFIGWVSRDHSRYLTWAPKILCIALPDSRDFYP